MNARHAAGDGAFARSAGGAAGRGIVLVAVAVLIGVALMRWGLDGPGDGTVRAGEQPSATTETSTDDTTASPPATDNQGSVVTPTSAAVTPVAPETVKVLVANGTPTQGVARSFTDTLNTQAYGTLAASNADNNAYTTSHVYYVANVPEAPTAAQQVATLLNVAAPPEPMPATIPLADPTKIADAMVLVVIGADLATPPA